RGPGGHRERRGDGRTAGEPRAGGAGRRRDCSAASVHGAASPTRKEMMSIRIAGAYSVGRGEGSLRRRVNRLLVIGLGVLLLMIILLTGTAVLAAIYGLRAVQARSAETSADWLHDEMTAPLSVPMD